MTTDKRAAAIADLIVRDVAEIPDRCSPDDQPEMMLVTSDELTHIVMRRLAALEADDGRALLRQLRAEFSGLPSGGPRCMVHRDHLLSRIDKIIAAPEQPAPLCCECGDPMPVPLAHCCEKPEQPAPEPTATSNHDKGRVCLICGKDVPSGERYSHGYGACMPVEDDEPAAPHADDEARILAWATGPVAERTPAKAVAIMRSLAAGKAKAEAEVERLTGIIDDTTNTEATNADTVADLREKLADAQADVERLRGRDAEPFDWDAAPSVQEWIDENLPEREPRAGSKMVELHPDEVIADRGESRRVAGWLKDLMAENARLRAERDAAQENLAWAMKQRDAALAAQNARAGLLGRAVEAISECLPDEDLNDLSTHFHMECKRHHFERLKDVRDEMECALRAAKPEPAAEPAPAAADAKPGDEVLRKVWDALRNTPHAAVSLEQQKWCIAVERVVCELVDRALEVRP